MKKNLLRTMFMTIMIVASFSFVACGENVKKADTETTGAVETTTVETESTTEIPTTSEVETTTEEITTEELTTEEITTEELTTEESTTEEITTEETTTEPITEEPMEMPTNEPVASLESRYHIAYQPEDSKVAITIVGNSIVGIPCENYREPADYVDEDCSGANPYKMYEWTERRYRTDVDELTLGYYEYNCDITNEQYSEEFRKLWNEQIDDECYLYTIDTQLLIGTYEGVDIYFNYVFKDKEQEELYKSYK